MGKEDWVNPNSAQDDVISLALSVKTACVLNLIRFAFMDDLAHHLNQ